MPKKVYTLHGLDCANCAAKIEAKFNALPQVQEAVIVFPTRQLQLTADEPDSLLPQLEAVARTVESGFAFAPSSGASDCHHDRCTCGHSHEHAHDHRHSPSELPGILLGAGLFAAGLLFSAFQLSWVCLGVFVAAYLLLGGKVLLTAGKNLLRGHIFDENFLMSLATVGAFAIGEAPEAVGVMLFYRIGEFFEHKAVERSRSQIMAAADLRPETVTLSDRRVIPAENARPGDRILVHPGDRIPLDALVVSGSSRIDTAPITGEPVPVSVAPGSEVVSGCVNLSGQLVLQVRKPLSESMVTRILHSVENAAASKPKMDRFLTRFSRIYTPAVVGLAVATAVIPSLFDGRWSHWVYTALSFLVMSCPCALVLSVPLAFFSGIGAGSKQGILFKGGLSMEAMAKIRVVAMDKTGTLTSGRFAVQHSTLDEAALMMCASLEAASTHPVAVSITAFAREQGLSLFPPEQTEELPGLGIRGKVNGHTVLCGNEALMAKFGIVPPGKQAVSYGTQVLVAVDGAAAGEIRICDAIKPDAPAALLQLRELGMTPAMLTGDREAAAGEVSGILGIDRVYAGLLPDEKQQVLLALRRELGPVMFVGDGINDAPVLSGADVGAAMGSGADAATEAADVVFMANRASAIPQSLTIARRTLRIAWQGVIFALAVKAVVMVLGLLGWASMWAAVFADSGVAMLCVLNAMRLLWEKPRQDVKIS